MANTSASGGPLLPTGAAPVTDLDFARVMSQLVGGITGLGDEMVRPRWQPIPPQQPALSEDWCAIGVQSITPEGMNPVVVHNSSGDGSSTLIRHEILEIIASFYGPDCTAYASQFRDGLYISQNLEPLYFADVGLIDVGPIRNAAELLNTRWRLKQDLTLRLRRRITRTYNVRNLLSAHGTIATESVSQDFSTEN